MTSMTIEAARINLMNACEPVTVHGVITAEQIAVTIARIHAAEEAFQAALNVVRRDHVEHTPVPFPEFA